MEFKKIGWIFISFLVLCGCGSIPEIHYYKLSSLAEQKKNGTAKYPFILGIENFSADPVYNQERIVYRNSPFEVKFYNYHQWISTPNELINQKTIDHFLASGLFKQVVKFPRIERVDFLLTGTIKAFEEWDEGDDWFGSVILDLQFIDVNRHSARDNILWEGRMNKRNKVIEKKPIYVVQALDLSVQQCLEEALKTIDQVLTQEKDLN